MDPIATKRERPVVVFEFPEEIVEKTEGRYKSVSMVELTTGEEMAAAKRARNDQLRMVAELIKQSIVAVNGEKVSLANQSVDKAWEEFPAVVRSLVMAAYSQIHQVEEESTTRFLASRRTEVGK